MSMPALFEDGRDPLAFAGANRTRVRRALTEHGAVLLRGFDVDGADGLDALVLSLSGSAPLAYTERSSPRTTIKGRVYTSTDYPREEEIFLHNENSYQASWPLTLYFHCVEPPTRQGATPLADTRRIYHSIDPSVREEFTRRGWMVVRNFHGGFGVSWQQAFGTEDRDAVGEYCAERRMTADWLPGGGLRTIAVRQAVHVHPQTAEAVWFNHATFFHVSTLSAEIREGLLAMYGEQGLPTNTYYGDGGQIPADVLDHLRDRYRAASVRFDWEQDDVLVVDNMLAAHGREPYEGPRRIAVAMAESS
jgi:alpha-ketoglutarate-dependent taurine dioxygenase